MQNRGYDSYAIDDQRLKEMKKQVLRQSHCFFKKVDIWILTGGTTMSTQKGLVVVNVVVLLLLINTMLIGCRRDDMSLTEPTTQLSEIIEEGKLSEVSLTIYYMSPLIATRYPLSVDDLITHSKVDQIDISGERLEAYVELLNRMVDTTLIPVRKESYLSVRIYYVFKTEKASEVFEVAMWGGNDEKSMLVNGVEVVGDEIFDEVLKAFLPDNMLREAEMYYVR